MMDSFQIIPAAKNKVPVIVSVPHCGTVIPPEIKSSFKPAAIAFMDDTDWFVNRLYDFVPEMGITMIHAIYSRWVIDLNRPPGNQPLYKDGRIITDLVPTTDFLGNDLYQDAPPDEKEITRRTRLYYNPYHKALADLLQGLREEFGSALLFDAHSIRQHVPTISKEKLPDLILGDNEGMSAGNRFTKAALHPLKQSPYGIRHNFLFKGGYITRNFGQPKENIHALQLEMTKINYMNEYETSYHPQRAMKIKETLMQVFKALIDLI